MENKLKSKSDAFSFSPTASFYRRRPSIVAATASSMRMMSVVAVVRCGRATLMPTCQRAADMKELGATRAVHAIGAGSVSARRLVGGTGELGATSVGEDDRCRQRARTRRQWHNERRLRRRWR
ncbi:hypothetical protein ACLOJK_005001 [Asimina triloba]